MKMRIFILAVLALLILLGGCTASVRYYLNGGGGRVSIGLENFIASKAKKYRGKKAALVTNHSGYDFNLEQNIRLLRDRGIDIIMIMAPEHGIWGYKNDLDYKYSWYDQTVKSPVFNLFTLDRQNLRVLFQKTDIVIFDIQDMGMRCYTYITNLKDVIDALDGLDRELIILDRPNPLGFLGVDGANLEPRYTTRWVSAFPAPFLYDMTIGESALYYRGEARRTVKIKVIRMKGFSRRDMFPETGQPWIPPSPNLPTYESSIVYSAVVLMEGINLSLGRGTTKPFEYIGAPWIEPVSFCSILDGLGLPNFRFKPVYFKPLFGKYTGMRCGGAQIFYTGGIFSPTEVSYRIIGAIMKRYRYAQWVQFGYTFDIDGLAGTSRFREGIQAGKSWEAVLAELKPGIKAFEKKRKKYLLY